MGYTGSLEKMVVKAYENDSYSGIAAAEMTVFINPEQYTHEYQICYNDTQAQGSAAGSPQYNKTPADVLTFQLIFDGTGVIPGMLPGLSLFTEDGIVTQVKTFMDLVFKYDGDIHSPNFVQITWGTLSFNCRLKTMKLTYTLFKPDGTPLRAKADTVFIGFRDQTKIAAEEAKNSPDLSHMVTVKQADTLPDLCYEIYGSSVYYTQVARWNGLTNFRRLIPGTKLLFPPLGDAR